MFAPNSTQSAFDAMFTDRGMEQFLGDIHADFLHCAVVTSKTYETDIEACNACFDFSKKVSDFTDSVRFNPIYLPSYTAEKAETLEEYGDDGEVIAVDGFTDPSIIVEVSDQAGNYEAMAYFVNDGVREESVVVS